MGCKKVPGTNWVTKYTKNMEMNQIHNNSIQLSFLLKFSIPSFLIDDHYLLSMLEQFQQILIDTKTAKMEEREMTKNLCKPLFT